MNRHSLFEDLNRGEFAMRHRTMPWHEHSLQCVEQLVPCFEWLWRRRAGSLATGRYPDIPQVPVDLPRIRGSPLMPHPAGLVRLRVQTGALVRATALYSARYTGLRFDARL